MYVLLTIHREGGILRKDESIEPKVGKTFLVSQLYMKKQNLNYLSTYKIMFVTAGNGSKNVPRLLKQRSTRHGAGQRLKIFMKNETNSRGRPYNWSKVRGILRSAWPSIRCDMKVEGSYLRFLETAYWRFLAPVSMVSDGRQHSSHGMPDELAEINNTSKNHGFPSGYIDISAP